MPRNITCPCSIVRRTIPTSSSVEYAVNSTSLSSGRPGYPHAAYAAHARANSSGSAMRMRRAPLMSCFLARLLVPLDVRLHRYAGDGFANDVEREVVG